MPRKYILSLDGAGVYAILPAVALAKLEQTTGRLTREIFSMVDGASTCGAVAAWIAAGVPATHIVDVLMMELPQLFHVSGVIRTVKLVTKGYTYAIERLHQALLAHLGEARNWTLNDCPVDIFFLTRRVSDGTPFYLVKDNPLNSQCYGRLRLADCATAAGAIPTFFEPWKMELNAPVFAECEPLGELLDGTLGGGSNLYWACTEAYYYGAYSPHETTVVSIGTERTRRAGESPSGFLAWVSWIGQKGVPSLLRYNTELLKRHFPAASLYRLSSAPPGESVAMYDFSSMPIVRQWAEQFAARLDWSAILEGAETPDLVETPRQAASAAVSPDVPPAETPYHKAAAVLAYYDPETLRPFEPDYLEHLVSDSAIITDQKGQARWTLSSEVRQRVLRSLGGPDQLKRALEANPARSKDTLQTMLERYINGDPPAVDQQDIGQLTAALQILEWFGDVLPGLPDETEVRNRIERLRLLDTFRQLADSHFRGRKDELRDLRKFVGVLEPATVADRVAAAVRSLGSEQRAPMIIYGPGGCGKSALLSRFILEHADSSTPVPFLYFDFDRTDLLPEEPATLLLEGLRQIALQYPRSRRECEAVRRRWSQRLADESEHRDAGHLGLLPPALQKEFLDEFLDVLGRIPGINDQPLVLILDTFEDVQVRRPEAVRQLWRLLEDLQRGYPSLRCILAGRAQLKGYDVTHKPLGQLDQESAVAVLESYGVASREVAERIVKQIGGDPLSLRLAADVIAREQPGEEGITGLETSRFLFFRVGEEMIQGQLYRRILGYIEDRDVRRLANPGLALRRITPGLIRHVLAGPCEVEVPDDKRARELFAKLQKQVALVVPADEVAPSDPEAIRHRPDIRRIMLRLLRQDQPEKVRQIGQNAIRYYADEYDRGHRPFISRAEEIYHRLALGENPEEVAARWEPGVEKYLQTALEDLPPRSQAFLASRMGIPLNKEIAAQADQDSWEREATRRVEALLRSGDLVGTRRALSERSDRRPGSPLYRLEAEVWKRSGDWNRALQVVADGLASGTETAGNEPLRLVALRAELQQNAGIAVSPEVALDEYETFLRRYASEHELLLRLGLFRRSGLKSVQQGSLDKLMLGVVDQLPEKIEYSLAETLRQTAVALKDSYPERMIALIRRTGLGAKFIRANLPKLAEFLALWDAASSGALALEAGVEAEGSLQERWSRYLVLTPIETATRTIDGLLRRNDLPRDAFEFLAKLIERG
jgi:hypothetical protein